MRAITSDRYFLTVDPEHCKYPIDTYGEKWFFPHLTFLYELNQNVSEFL